MIEYFTANLWQLWLLISIICLIIELTSGDFFVICFAIGAACALVLSTFVPSFYAQIAVFAIASVICIFFVRPLMLKYFHRNDNERLSNADALIGREGRVLEAIKPDGTGRVGIDGDNWKAITANGESIEEGAKVRVIDRKSIIITVERI